MAELPDKTKAAVIDDTNNPESSWDPVLSRLLTSLKQLQPYTDDDVIFLTSLLKSRHVNALVQAHNKIVSKGKNETVTALLSNAMQVTVDVITSLDTLPGIAVTFNELLEVLQLPHVQAILYTHDAIAQKNYYPELPELRSELDEDEEEETVKIVQLVKSDEPLGATIKTDEATGKIVIARVMHGGAADRSGLIHAGDEVIEVNGQTVENKTPAEVLSILQNSEGTITFKLVPSACRSGGRESKVRVRALFDYNSADDPYIPCKEAGLNFKRGDILHIVSQDDQYWWQARREGDRVMRAGLIPSRTLQEGRMAAERQKDAKDENDKTPLCPAAAVAIAAELSSTKIKKIIYDTSECDDFDRELLPTYEEVARLYPTNDFVRPIVLIGAPGVGRNELRRRLIATDPQKYATPIPFTSRRPKACERNNVDYMFVTRDEMEADIASGLFIEHGEYKGNLYGTSFLSVEEIIKSGRVCVLSPHWQALKMIRTPLLRPYVIFVKPPSLARLIETRNLAHARSTFDKNTSRAFTEDEFEQIIKSSERIEYLYGYMFDEEVVNEDLSSALSQILVASRRAQVEPLWVPAMWPQ